MIPIKKTLLIVLVLALSLSFAAFALAGDDAQAARPFQGAMQRFCDLPQLDVSEDQKAQMNSLMVQIHELKKEIIQSNIDNGTITKEQGEKMLKRQDSRIEAIKSGNYKMGMGRQGLRGGFHRFRHGS